MDEVPKDFVISDIREPPIEMKGRVYASCVISSMIYGSETRLLLADVELIFERAELQMIRWMCGVSMKDDHDRKKLRRNVINIIFITYTPGTNKHTHEKNKNIYNKH